MFVGESFAHPITQHQQRRGCILHNSFIQGADLSFLINYSNDFIFLLIYHGCVLASLLVFFASTPARDPPLHRRGYSKFNQRTREDGEAKPLTLGVLHQQAHCTIQL
jgi:hypothetical protein